MRFHLLALLAIGCGKKPAPEGGSLYRFLPDKPDVVVRLDVAKIRAWPTYSALGPALKVVESQIELPKRECGLDLIAESQTFMLAMRGGARDGDLSVIVTGLPRDKTTACIDKLAKKTPKGFAIDGSTFQLLEGGSSTGSGAILPGGEVVIVSRAGKGVEPAAWKQEIAAGPGEAPAWSTELDQAAPIAMRVVSDGRVATGSVMLAEPLVVKGTVVSADEATAKKDLETYRAVLNYLQSGGAGSGRLEQRGETIYGDFTSAGPQVDALLGMALPALFRQQTTTAALVDPAGPQATDCAALPDAVSHYLATAMSTAAPETKEAMQRHIDALQTKLAKAYVDACTADHWSATSITCHVQNGSALKRFEQCRETLSGDQRAHFDDAIKQATTSP